MPPKNRATSLILPRAVWAAAALEVGLILFLLFAFPIFSSWMGDERWWLIPGYLLSWMPIGLGALALFGRCEVFPWPYWLVTCALRAALPWSVLVLMTGGTLADLGDALTFGAGIFAWGGLLWSMPGALTYGVVWERRYRPGAGT